MILKVLSQSLLVARIRGESSFCLCLSLSFRISFCLMCLWLWMCWLLRQSWCECASVCLCLCASVWGCGGVPVWVGSRSHRILPTSSLFASVQHNYKNKNVKRNDKTSSPFASVQFCYIKYKSTTYFNQSKNRFSFYHYSESLQNPSQWHLCSKYGDRSKNGLCTKVF